MRIINLYKILLFSVLSFSLPLYGQNVNFIDIDSSVTWDNILKSADKEGKNIFLDIYATWCGPCKMMDTKVYTDSVLADYFNQNYVNARIDGESEFGVTLARSFKLTVYPSMYFINSKKETILTVKGYRDPDALFSIGKQVNEKGETYLSLNKKFDSGTLSPEEQNEFLDLLLEFNQDDLLRQVMSAVLDNFTEENVFDPANKKLILKSGGDIESKTVNVVINNASHFRDAWGTEDFIRYLSDVYNLSMQKAINEKNEGKMIKVSDLLIPVYLQDSPLQIQAAKFTTRKIYYSQLRNWEKYIETIDDFHLNSGLPAKTFYFGEIYYIIENQIYNEKILLQALDWINREIKLQPDFESYFLGTVIHSYRRDFVQVNDWMSKAETLAVTEEEKRSVVELKKFIEKIRSGNTLDE